METRARNLGGALGSALCQQLIVFSIALALLDGGVLAQVCGIAVAAFWAGVGVICFRRRGSFSKMDLLFIEVATVPLVVVATFVSFRIWRARGLL
jgi:hypothetical protein